MVDVPVQEHHHHFLSHPRQADLAELAAGNWHAHAHPWRAVLIVSTHPVPVELQLDAAQAVRVNVLAGGTDDDRRLHAGIEARRAIMGAARPPAHALAHARHRVVVVRYRPRPGLVVVAGVMVDRHDYIVALGKRHARRLAAEVAAQLETAAGLGVAVVAGSVEILAHAIERFHVARGQRLALVLVAVAERAGVAEALIGAHVALAIGRVAEGALRARLLVVEAGQGKRAAAEFPRALPAVDAVAFVGARFAAEHDFTDAVINAMLDPRGEGGVIGQPQRVAIKAVLVPVVQAQVFPAPVQVVIVGFVVLIGAGKLGVRIVEAGAIVALQIVGEHRLGQFDDAFVMERDAVLAQFGKAKPGAEYHLVEGEAAVCFNQAKLLHIAVEVAQRAVGAHQRNRDHLRHDRLERNIGVVGQEFEVDAKVARQLLARMHRVHQQHAFFRTVVEWKLETQQAVALRGLAKGGQGGNVGRRFAQIHVGSPWYPVTRAGL